MAGWGGLRRELSRRSGDHALADCIVWGFSPKVASREAPVGKALPLIDRRDTHVSQISAADSVGTHDEAGPRSLSNKTQCAIFYKAGNTRLYGAIMAENVSPGSLGTGTSSSGGRIPRWAGPVPLFIFKTGNSPSILLNRQTPPAPVFSPVSTGMSGPPLYLLGYLLVFLAAPNGGRATTPPRSVLTLGR